jgi:hypothetical protein
MPDTATSRDDGVAAVRETIDAPRLLQLLDYWQSKCPSGGLPGRPDLDPWEMRFILGNLLLVDVERPGPGFRYRLVGTNLTTRLGLDMQGRTFDDHPDPTFRARGLPIYTAIAETGVPQALCRDDIIDGRLRQYQVLLLPLAVDGRTVDMIMVAYHFDGEPGR